MQADPEVTGPVHDSGEGSELPPPAEPSVPPADLPPAADMPSPVVDSAMTPPSDVVETTVGNSGADDLPWRQQTILRRLLKPRMDPSAGE